ncbi:MAG: hypothetical protein WCJ19_05905, partial [bacterium]
GRKGFAPPLDPLLGKEGKIIPTVALRQAQGDIFFSFIFKNPLWEEGCRRRGVFYINPLPREGGTKWRKGFAPPLDPLLGKEGKKIRQSPYAQPKLFQINSGIIT